MSKNVLVLSGGGAKGLIQASALYHVSFKKTIEEQFDLIIGSSVGAINGTILARGHVSTNELYSMYPGMLDAIFSRPWYPTVPKYSRKNFQKCWGIMHPTDFPFGDVKTKMVVTSVDRCQDKMHYFKSWEDKDGAEMASDVVMRSFAAPYFFGQLSDPTNQCVWFDGGCGSYNLPAIDAFIETELLGWHDEDTTFWLFGTGFVNDAVSYDKASKGNIFDQVGDFINPTAGGMARAMSRIDQISFMAKMCSVRNNLHLKYFDIEIPPKLDGMDIINKKAEYKEFGKKMAEKPLIEI